MRFGRIFIIGTCTLSFITVAFIVQTHRSKLHVTYAKDSYRDYHWVSYGYKEANSSPALYYCNFPSPDDYSLSEEGSPSDPRWILKQVQVVVRHGDRSPMGFNLYEKLNIDPNYCSVRPDEQPTHPTLAKFIKSITEDRIKMNLQGNKLVIGDPFPNHHRCGPAMLSQLGVVQHLHNGELLRKKYVETHGLLSDAIKNQSLLQKKVFAMTTAKARTAQSAVAFLYGLIPDFHLQLVYLRLSRSDIFTFDQCKSAANMINGIKNVQYKSYLDYRDTTPFKKLSRAFDTGDHAGSLIDQFVTGFLCKSMKLPCYNGECVALEDLDDLLEAEAITMQRISEEASFTNQSMLNLQPLLQKMSKLLLWRVENESSPDFALFSGHDTTLKPLIRALGIPEYRWPRLGTRLVFELWFDPVAAEHYIRILLNGKDYTMIAKPCSEPEDESESKGICEAQKFHSYVNQNIFKHFGAQTRQEACFL